MNDKRFREDMDSIELIVIQLRSLCKEYEKDEMTKLDMIRAVKKSADMIEEKLDEVIKDVYSDLIHKGEWLDRQGNELPI